MTDYTDIISRLEKAEGPDRELDARIWCTMHGVRFKEHYDVYGRDSDRLTQVVFSRPPSRKREVTGYGYYKHAELYTASIDAAVALVERLAPDMRVENLCEWDHPRLRVQGPWSCDLVERGKDCTNGKKAKCSHAPTPALALLSALFRALRDAQREERQP